MQWKTVLIMNRNFSHKHVSMNASIVQIGEENKWRLLCAFKKKKEQKNKKK